MSKSGISIAAFFIVFLFFPYALLLIKLPSVVLPESSEFIWALGNSGLQAFGAAFGTLLLALLFAPGFSFLANHFPSRILEFLILIPTLLPSLFIILVVISTLSPFPIGLIGVVFIHIVLNTGLATVLIMQIISRKLIPLLELSAVEGASRWKFLKASWGWIYKDIFGIFIFLFILCFANFSVPFVAGGGKATTLEILIYEKIKISGDWGQALSLAIIQLVILAGFSFFNPHFKAKLTHRSYRIALLPSLVSAIALLIFILSPLLIFLVNSISAWEQVFLIPGLWSLALDTISNTLLFSFCVGFLVLFLLLLSAFVEADSFIHRLLLSVLSPSTALVGFSLIFFLEDQEPWNSLKWIIGFTYLIFTGLYRWGWRQALTDLEQQIAVAKSLGASHNMIFLRIKMPQLILPACRIAGIASLWAIGDFALGKIIFGEDVTLALLIETLMASYRTEAALALMSLLMVLGALSYFFFWGVGYVGRRASEQEV